MTNITDLWNIIPALYLYSPAVGVDVTQNIITAESHDVGSNPMRVALNIYIGLTLVVISQAAMFFVAGLSFSGYWFDKLLVWLWLASTPFFIIRDFKNWTAKVYTALLVAVLLLSVVPFFLPVFMFVTFVTANDRCFKKEISNRYHIQEVMRSPMVGKTFEVVRRYGIIEKACNLGPGYQMPGDTIYYLFGEISVRIIGTDAKRMAEIELPHKKVSVALPHGCGEQ